MCSEERYQDCYFDFVFLLWKWSSYRCLWNRGNDAYLLEDSKPLSNCEDDGTVRIRPSEVQENGEEIVNGPSNGEPLTWQLEDVDCPKG